MGTDLEDRAVGEVSELVDLQRVGFEQPAGQRLDRANGIALRGRVGQWSFPRRTS
jgi:hypothetical protein